MKRFEAFRQSCQHLEAVLLPLVLDDIKKRIGDAVLSDDQIYLAEQKRKALIVQLEMKRRLENQ